jgi:hypothetical protein
MTDVIGRRHRVPYAGLMEGHVMAREAAAAAGVNIDSLLRTLNEALSATG